MTFGGGAHCGGAKTRCILKAVRIPDIILRGKYIRLEPLALQHVDALVEASAVDPALYAWSPVPRSRTEAAIYRDCVGLAAGRQGSAVCDRAHDDGAVIGSTRFFDLEHWAWPPGHPRHGRVAPDGCEIGYTWLTRSAVRTRANTEAKLLMLAHAFEAWEVLRVCLHTDVRNERSRAAIERIGGKFEGILRSHRMAADFIARDSARFSIVAAEWPDVKVKLTGLLTAKVL